MTQLPAHALSLIQPWAWLMLEAPADVRKDVENRDWPTTFRGDVWVHASKRMTRDDYEGAIGTAELVLGAVPRFPDFKDIPRGGIVGRFRIVTVKPPPNRSPGLFAETKPGRWHFPDSYGFYVEDARAVPFVACKGALGFWRVPPDVLEQLRERA